MNIHLVSVIGNDLLSAKRMIWAERFQINCGIEMSDKNWLLHIKGRRSLDSQTNFQTAWLWQILQLHLLRGPCQPEVGGLERNRMESCRKRGKPKKGAEDMNMKAENLPRGGDWQCFSFMKRLRFWMLTSWYFMINFIEFCYEHFNILQLFFC